MSVAHEPAVTGRTNTQRLFGLGAPTRDVDDRGEPLNRMSMDIAALAAKTADISYGGVLAVLLDDLLGFTVWDRRGTRDGLVTAELSMDVVTPRRWRARRCGRRAGSSRSPPTAASPPPASTMRPGP
ncbi:hypothetical protein [Rhodococcus koreensis]|uniref:hypothetical protein n=1 Tax=Rhodococcus koreensis TaxID=99653 RepID=UPI00366D940B